MNNLQLKGYNIFVCANWVLQDIPINHTDRKLRIWLLRLRSVSRVPKIIRRQFFWKIVWKMGKIKFSSVLWSPQASEPHFTIVYVVASNSIILVRILIFIFFQTLYTGNSESVSKSPLKPNLHIGFADIHDLVSGDAL